MLWKITDCIRQLPIPGRWGFVLRQVDNGQTGSVLIALIVSMTVVAGIGTAMVNMFSASNQANIGAMESTQALYLAEAGARYGKQEISSFEDGTSSYADRNALISALNNQTFTLTDGKQFQLTLSYSAPIYTLTSKGVASAGAERKTTYTITVPTPPATVTIPFNVVADITNNWDITSDKPDDIETIDGSPAVNLRGKLTDFGLAWNGSATLPNLATLWASNSQLLSYDIQVKSRIAETNKEFMVGISFRKNDSSNNSYGLSFVKPDTCHEVPAGICSGIAGSTTAVYIVLWKKVAGTYTVLKYKQAAVADGVLDGGQLRNWSTLVVSVTEQMNGASRENRISAYVQGTDNSDAIPYSYARGTVLWSYGKFNAVQWNGGATNPIIDTSLTSANFSTIRPEEIGLHSFYQNNGNSKVHMDDFAVRFYPPPSSGLLPSSQY